MLTYIDFAIVAVFLIVNLTVGIWVGRGIKTIGGYAVGDRNFSTATLAATIIATWMSGSFFTICVSQTYTEGVWFIPAALGAILSLLIVGYVFGPRMKEFFGDLSVAETMGKLFGNKVRMITAICSIAQAIAMTALQIKVFSSAFSHFLGFSSVHATCISSFVVIAYSAWGGIKAVTLTDVIQFLTFGMFIPLFLLFVLHTFVDLEVMAEVAHTNPLLDYTQLLNWQNAKFFPNLVTMLWFLLPSLSSPVFQRILMARDTKQIGASFGIAALGYGFMVLSTCAIGMLILSIDPTLEPSNIVMHTVDSYTFTGLKGFTLIGIMAMIMSTADSWINSGSVIFAHDLCKTVGLKLKNGLLVARIFSLCIGCSALFLVLYNHNLLALFSLQANFYMPVVTVPLILAIFGFRSSAKSVILGMISGITCVVLWKIYAQPYNGVDSVIPGLITNLIVLISFHYLTKQPGGWIGIKDDSDLQQLRRTRSQSFSKFRDIFSNIHKINIIDYCNKQSPQNNITYFHFAFAVLLTTSILSSSIDKAIYHEYFGLINFFVAANLLITTVFITYHFLWHATFTTKYIGLIWHIAVFFSLAVTGTFLTLMCNFSTIAIVVLIIDLTIISYLMRWQIAFPTIISGVCLALFCYTKYIGTTSDITSELANMQWNILYILCTVGGLSLAFLKPKQDYQELVEEKNRYLDDMMRYKDVELEKAIELKHEFLRNLEHEAHTPITGITSMGQVLWESYDLLSEKQRRQGLEDIAKSSERLASLVNNMIDLSKLSSFKYELNKTPVNISSLLKQRLETCKRLYLKNKQLEFIENIPDKIIAHCDNYYITRVIDNLLINAIAYSKTGKITVTANNLKDAIEFSVADEGIGIPAAEIYDVFEVFVVSSKTRSPAGGRGIGLALCKKSMEEHGGTIKAESDGVTGATFACRLPK